MLLSNAAIKNRTTVMVLMFLIAIAGIYCYASLPREAEPEPPPPAEQKGPTAQAGPAAKPASLYAARRGAGRAQALKQFGGTADTENAVELGLEWFARHQEGGGEWRGGALGSEPALTGLALMAFLGAGCGPDHPKYGNHTSRAIAWLIDVQTDDGLIGPASKFDLYCQGIATLALAEALNMTKDTKLARPVAQAAQFIIGAQQEQGGWDYRKAKTGRNDTSVTCWQIMALMSARRAGVEVPRECMAGILRHLEKVTRASGQVQYLQRHRHTTMALTAAGTFCHMLLGWSNRSTVVRRSANWLKPRAPSWVQTQRRGFYPLYYWYYGTLTMFQMGGPYWAEWNKSMRPLLVRKQRRTGDLRGSWDPVGYDGRVGGRVYATALCVLDLEVYYRYLPLYHIQDAAVVDVWAPDLVDEHGKVRTDMVGKLIGVGPASATHLIAVYDRCSESLRARIVQFLTAAPLTPPVREALLRCLAEPNKFIRIKAAGALAEAKHPQALAPLCALVREDNTFFRSQAVDALSLYDAPEALEALVRALGDKQGFVAKKALKALMAHTHQQDFGLNPDLPPKQRRAALAKWEQWLASRREAPPAAGEPREQAP